MAYVARRLLYAVFVVASVSVFVFFLARLSGDPVALMLPPGSTMAEAEELRHQLGFDLPVEQQFVVYVSNVVRGDFGTSVRHGRPAMELILEAFPATIKLAGLAFAISLLLAIPTGILSAVHRNSAADILFRILSLIGQCFPNFWLGLMLIIVFALTLRWLPPSGSGGVEYLILPSIALGLYFATLTSRLLRAAMLDVMGEDYIRTARSKGLAENLVLFRHALRNAALPVVTVLGINMGHLLGGSVVIEQVFAYPGMGRLAYQAIMNRDFPIMQAFVIFVALIVVLISFSMDVAYAYLDPRVIRR